MGLSVDDLLTVPFLTRTQEERIRIITEGKPRPFLQMAAAVTMSNDGGILRTHQFDPAMYDEVQWLTGCDRRHTFFCWPCLLFMPTVGLWNTTGISDLVYFIEGKTKHEDTFEHMQATLKMQAMIELNTKASAMDVSEHNEIVKRNRAILKRLIDVVCNLLTKEQPSYKRIKGCELDPENCLKNLKFLRTYDVLNCNFIEDAMDLVQISPSIVNDLIDTISRGIRMAIGKEVRQSTYGSIILTDHSKTANRSQISTVLRYLKCGKVCEKFIGYLNLGDRKSVETVYQHIVGVLNEFSLSERFLALSLDGGILKAPELAELTTMIKNVYPFAFFVPWYGHGLDYVLQQSLANIKECSMFFKTINELKVFFQKKSRRFKRFENFMAGSVSKDTKWFVRSQFIQMVNNFRKYFMQFFDSILQGSSMWEPDDVTKAMGFLRILEDFRTVFLLELFTKLFEETSSLNKWFKSASPEQAFTTKEVSRLIERFIEMRDRNFEYIWMDVQLKQSNAKPGPASKKIKIDMDDPKIAEYRLLYDSIINHMLQEIDVRLGSLDQLSFCQLLSCDNSGQFTFTNEMIETLMTAHGTFFDEEQIKNELIVLRTNGTVFSKKSIYLVLDFLIQAKLKGAFKYVYKLAEFILTLPIKPPTEEVSLDKFKDIRDWSYIPEAIGVQSGDVSVPCVELEFLQELKKSDTFHEEIAVIFYETNKTFELMYK